MPKTYKISSEDAKKIKEVRKTIKYKQEDKRLYAVQLIWERKTNHERNPYFYSSVTTKQNEREL